MSSHMEGILEQSGVAKTKRSPVLLPATLSNLAPQVRLELTTLRLTAGCSAIELLRNKRPRIIWNYARARRNFYSRWCIERQGDAFALVMNAGVVVWSFWLKAWVSHAQQSWQCFAMQVSSPLRAYPHRSDRTEQWCNPAVPTRHLKAKAVESADKILLLGRRELHHSGLPIRIERGKDSSVGAKVRMAHVCAFRAAVHLQCDAPEFFRRHYMLFRLIRF
jgi:hypothetical protein